MIVLDANAAVAMAQGGEAGQALRMLVGNGEAIIAPRCFVTEMGNVAWKYIRIGGLSEEEGIELFQNALDLIDGYADDESLLLEDVYKRQRCCSCCRFWARPASWARPPWPSSVP